MSHTFTLSLPAANVLLEHCGLGRAPVPFTVPYLGTTHTERAQVRTAVFRDLEDRGLCRAGRLDADVEWALRTFVGAPVTVSAAAQLDQQPLFARVGTDGQFAVLVRQTATSLEFTEARPTGLVPAIVDLLPLTPAAPGQSVTVARPAPRPKRRADVYDPFAGIEAPRSHASSQLHVVERIFAKPRLRIGQFTAAVPGRGGRSAELAPLVWFDTEAGRYLLTTNTAADGQQWLTYAPADNARIGQTLYSQLEPYL